MARRRSVRWQRPASHRRNADCTDVNQPAQAPRMHVTVFGLSVTSSWGNGHATFWRAICRALARRGHRVEFFERDQWFYYAHRDLDRLPDHDLHVYPSWQAIAGVARASVRRADAAIVTSFCADA